jgi:hypothetical protein
MDVCEKCGVPLKVSRELTWDANGVISLASSPRNRMVFFESENIDQLFKGIEALIGMPVERMVIESRCRETKRYIERIFPPEIFDTLGPEAVARLSGTGGDDKGLITRESLLLAIKAVTDVIIGISRVYGYGDQQAGDLWESGDDYPWRTQTIRNPYSLLLMAADNLGSIEAFERVSMRVKYEEMEQNTYSVEVFPGKHPISLNERLKRRRYDFKPGDITYERCPDCGIPLEVARRKWNLDEGTITDLSTGRRMALFGPFSVDSILDDLESELGGAIAETVIEAQRRYTKSAWGEDRWNKDGATFQHMVALRGLGNLVDFEGDRNHLTMTIQNSCLQLPMVGTTQAMVELAYRVDSSNCEWELSEDGDLNVTISVR